MAATALPTDSSISPDNDASERGNIFASLRNRNFRLFFGGQLISQTGSWLTMIAQTLLVLKLSNSSGVAVGFLMAFQFGPVLLLGAWAGAVADRADKRTLLTWLQSAAMLQSVALSVLIFTDHASLPAVYALASLQGLITAFDNPCRRAFVVEMVPTEMLANAVSLNSAIMTASRVVGPALAGALVVSVGYGWTFLIDAASYIAVIVGLLMMRPSELRVAPRTERAKGQVAEGLRYIKANQMLFVPLVMMAIIGTFAFNLSVTVPLLVKNDLHRGDGTFTLLFSVISVGSLAGSLWTAQRRQVTSSQLVMATAAFGVSMMALAVTPGLIAAFVLSVPLGFASMTFMTSSTAIVQLLAAPEYRGRVLAIQAMVFLGSTPIGGPFVGWIADAAGPRPAIAVGAISCIVASLYGARALNVDLRQLTPPR
ncbi:MAG TPA: MFS transporter, partial [Ilumatobacteraceae bacterium]|nr:MFS transporter [Ilumatobacteraceae bacterium]